MAFIILTNEYEYRIICLLFKDCEVSIGGVMSRNFISITGDIGSGKTSIARELSKLLGFGVVSTGEIQREIAVSRGITTLELLSSGDCSVDAEIDTAITDLGKTDRKAILDSRLAWHFVPHSYKVYLAVNPLVGAKRVLGAGRASERNIQIDETLESNKNRMAKEDEVFKGLYGVDLRNKSNYDLVIDTSENTPEGIAKMIVFRFKERN